MLTSCGKDKSSQSIRSTTHLTSKMTAAGPTSGGLIVECLASELCSEGQSFVGPSANGKEPARGQMAGVSSSGGSSNRKI